MCRVVDFYWGNNLTQDDQGGLIEKMTFDRADRGEGWTMRSVGEEGTASAKAYSRSILEQEEGQSGWYGRRCAEEHGMEMKWGSNRGQGREGLEVIRTLASAFKAMGPTGRISGCHMVFSTVPGQGEEQGAKLEAFAMIPPGDDDSGWSDGDSEYIWKIEQADSLNEMWNMK